MQANNPPTFHPTVWPAEPPAVPPVTRYVLTEARGGRAEVVDVDRAREQAVLPPDFVLRELLEVPATEAGALALMQEWGLLADMATGVLDVGQARWNLCRLQAIARHLIAMAAHDEDGERGAWLPFAELAQWGPPTLNEARMWFRDALNEALRPFTVHVRLGPDDAALARPGVNLYNACGLQLARYLASELTVNRCANERCGRYFSVQRGGARSDYGQHRSRGVLYCSPLCAKAQAERQRRARRRQEKVKGTS